MSKQKTNPKFHHWIICKNNIDVGYVRLLDSDVGIMIKGEFQGLGYASDALKLVEIEAKKIGLKKLIALVKTNNEKSENLFINNNFQLKLYQFEKEL